ncbi:MAG: ribonuclease E/G [Filifactoraceae bacterium]
MKKLIIDKGLFYQRTAILDDGLVEFVDYKVDNGVCLGDIYIAKVKSVNKGNKSAFLELNDEFDGYLPKVKENLKQGSLIIVEVKKEAFGTKLPTVTEDISLISDNLVLLPNGNGIKFSRKLSDISNIEIIACELEKALSNQGLIIRSGAYDKDKLLLMEELCNLQNEYLSYELMKNISNKPKLIKKAETVYDDLLRSKKENYEVVVNDKELYKFLDKSKLIKDNDCLSYNDSSLFSIYGIDEEWILGKKYSIDGCELVIEETEAMTVIDVNSKGKEVNINREINILEINLSLCAKIVQIIILKNLSGIIVIDFISMKEKYNKELLVQRLKDEFKIDRNSVKILEITSLGLVQVVRQRKDKSISEKLTKKCRCCNGKGYEPNGKFKKIKFEDSIKLLGYDKAISSNESFIDIFSDEEKKLIESYYRV